MNTLTTVTVILALIGSALIGGIFFSFSSFIMKALDRNAIDQRRCVESLVPGRVHGNGGHFPAGRNSCPQGMGYARCTLLPDRCFVIYRRDVPGDRNG